MRWLSTKICLKFLHNLINAKNSALKQIASTELPEPVFALIFKS